MQDTIRWLFKNFVVPVVVATIPAFVFFYHQNSTELTFVLTVPSFQKPPVESSDKYKYNLRIENTGFNFIDKSMVVEPITLSVGNAKLIKIDKVESEPKSVDLEINFTEPNLISMNFDLLNKNNFIEYRLVLDEPINEIDLYGHIKGADKTELIVIDEAGRLIEEHRDLSLAINQRERSFSSFFPSWTPIIIFLVIQNLLTFLIAMHDGVKPIYKFKGEISKQKLESHSNAKLLELLDKYSNKGMISMAYEDFNSLFKTADLASSEGVLYFEKAFKRICNRYSLENIFIVSGLSVVVLTIISVFVMLYSLLFWLNHKFYWYEKVLGFIYTL